MLISKFTSLAPESSLQIYCSTRKKHPKTLGYVCVHDRQNSIIFFLQNALHILHLGFLIPLACFFHFAKIYNSIDNGAYSTSTAIPCANSTCFYALIPLYRREIDKQYLHCLVSMLFWHLANWISIRHALTHFTRGWFVTTSFQVSRDLFLAVPLVTMQHGYL